MVSLSEKEGRWSLDRPFPPRVRSIHRIVQQASRALHPSGFRNRRTEPPLCHKIFYWKKKKSHRLRKRRVGAPETSGTRPQAELPCYLQQWWPAHGCPVPDARKRVCAWRRPGPRADRRRGRGVGRERGVNARGAPGTAELRRRQVASAALVRARSALRPGFGFRVCVLACLSPDCPQSNNRTFRKQTRARGRSACGFPRAEVVLGGAEVPGSATFAELSPRGSGRWVRPAPPPASPPP
jgi:hypothetical protein